MTAPDATLLLKSSLQALQTDPDEARERFRAAAQANAEPCPSCGKVIVHRKGLGWCQDQEMSEKTLQARVRDRAKRRGWRVMHVGKAIAAYDKAGNPIWITLAEAGWPDLVLAKPGHHMIFVELKREVGVVSPEQVEWLQLLNRTGNYGIVIKPSDLRQGRVNAILAVGAPL